MKNTGLEQLAREHRKEQRLGGSTTCQLCGEADVRGLHQVNLGSPTEGQFTVTLCASCHVQLQGKRLTEAHHPAGRANDPLTVPIPATEHAILSDAQYDWPRETWRNPDGSPLLVAAASLRGWLDILQLLLERTIGWIPAFLEALDAALRKRHGSRWWEEPTLEGVIS